MKQHLRLIIVFLLFWSASCQRHAHIEQITVSSVELNKQSEQIDSATIIILDPYKTELDKIMNEVIGVSTTAMPKERDKSESLLGNWVSDISLIKTNSVYKPSDGQPAQMALFNYGGLRTSLPAGEITRGKIFELMPFENELVVLTITGAKMQELLKYLAYTGGQPVAGIQLGILPDKTPGKAVIGGVPFDPGKNYKVVTSDYLAAGGDKMNFFNEPLNRENTGLKIRDAIIEFCKEETAKGKKLNASLDGRIYYETK
ncbi:MAG: 5'-nucleotidase [Bacteroidia bacterium]